MRLFSKIAYHGSGKRFDKFNVSFMGTGEGCQVHGWGIYLAEDKDVSKGYRDELTSTSYDTKITIVDDKGEHNYYAHGFLATDENGNEIDGNDPYAFIAKLAIPVGGVTEDMSLLELLRERLVKFESNLNYLKENEGATWFGATPETVEKALHEILPNIKEIWGSEILKGGMVATVEIPDELVFAEENESIENQDERVKQVIYKLSEDTNVDGYIEVPSYRIPNETYIKNLIRKYIPEGHKTISQSEIIKDTFDDWENNHEEEADVNWLYNIFDTIFYANCGVSVPKDKLTAFSQDIFNYINKYKSTKKVLKWGSFSDFYWDYAEMSSPSEVSMELESLGINGIHYDGRRDGSCYVVFDPEHLKIIKQE